MMRTRAFPGRRPSWLSTGGCTLQTLLLLGFLQVVCAFDEAAPELPESEGGPGITRLKFGEKVKLEGLGPIIVNDDCTMRRIENWGTLTEGEQEASWRRISKRNQQRLERCKEKEANGELSGVDPSAKQDVLDSPVMDEVEDWDNEEVLARRLEEMLTKDEF